MPNNCSSIGIILSRRTKYVGLSGVGVGASYGQVHTVNHRLGA